MTDIEKKIGYEFRARSLLETALTHSSYSKEKGQDEGHNERLEYLGDAFLMVDHWREKESCPNHESTW